MILHTCALGPGERTAIWFQGCEKNCKGCMSPSSKNPEDGILVDTEKVIESIITTKDIEGVTISGGEPFLQVDALYEITKAIKERTNLGVIIYTGYYLSELRKINNCKINSIIDKYSDIIIDGPYIDDLNDGKYLRGSSNQTINYLTDRYVFLKENYDEQSRKVEIIASDKEVLMIGVPDKKTLTQWQNISKSLE